MELLLRVAKWSILAGGATLLLMVLKGPLDRRYRAKWRYWLWLALAAALVLSLVPWGNLLPETVRAVEPPVVVQVPQTTIVVGRDGLSLAPEGEREGADRSASAGDEIAAAGYGADGSVAERCGSPAAAALGGQLGVCPENPPLEPPGVGGDPGAL